MAEILICILLVAADVFTKMAALKYLVPIKSKSLIDGFFSLTYVENRGAAFGSMQGARWFFVIITVAIVVAAIIYYKRLEKNKQNILLRAAILLVASGAIGNLIDRVFRGYVVDFLDFYIFGYNFPVFNFADICVVVGAGLLLLWTFKSDTKSAADK